MMEDPIFEPWTTGDPAPPVADRTPPVGPVGGGSGARPAAGHSTVDFLRAVAVPYLEALCARLRLARHEASLQDLLGETERLVRFNLTPWTGPLSDSATEGAAMLEIGLAGDRDESVTAWYWLDRSVHAPDRVLTIESSKLTASRIEQIIFDFVGEVLQRS